MIWESACFQISKWEFWIVKAFLIGSSFCYLILILSIIFMTLSSILTLFLIFLVISNSFYISGFFILIEYSLCSDPYLLMLKPPESSQFSYTNCLFDELKISSLTYFILKSRMVWLLLYSLALLLAWSCFSLFIHTI